MQRSVALLLAFSLLAACARSKYTKAPTTPTDDPAFSAPEVVVLRGLDSDPPDPLKLFPGDIVQLTTLSSETLIYDGLIVDARGQLHVPLAGDIQVGGMELSKAERAIERGLRVYDRFVRANLIITTLSGHTASVLGAVTTPGRYEVNPGMRLADLLAVAGGPAVTRDNSQVLTLAGNLDLARLVRDGEPMPVSIQLAMQGDPRHNIRVRTGDQLFVPASLDKLIMVLGDVGAPTPIMYREGIRLSEALARAGGIDTSRGDRKDIRIVRGPLREPRVYTASFKQINSGKATDVELAPGDIVYVTKAWYASTSDVLNALAPILALANSVALLAIANSLNLTR